MKVFIVASLFFCLISCKDKTNAGTTPGGDSSWSTEKIRVVKSGLNHPWEILWSKDDHIWMTERGGKVSKIEPRTGNTVFSTSIQEVVSNGEGGLLGMVQHPDFLNNGFIYVVYNYQISGDYREKVVRFRFADNTLKDPLVLLQNIPASGIHNGSRLWITEDNKLLVSTGDASSPSSAQNTSSLAGKILRLNLDGTIPADNPFPNNPVWSYGHRNPQGLVIANGLIYISEHGPSVEDEVNIIQKGRNYGWPNVTGPCDGSEQTFCTTNNIAPPIWSSGGSTVATAGLDYYGNTRIASWNNSILMTTLKDATLYQLKLNSEGTSVQSVDTFFKGAWGRLRDICISPAGRVYICTSNGNDDKIIEISSNQ